MVRVSVSRPKSPLLRVAVTTSCTGMAVQRTASLRSPMAVRKASVLMKIRQRRRLTVESELAPAPRDGFVDASAQQGALRKFGEMAVRLARIDQRFRSIGPFRHHDLARIEAGRPGLAQQVDVVARIAAG